MIVNTNIELSSRRFRSLMQSFLIAVLVIAAEESRASFVGELKGVIRNNEGVRKFQGERKAEAYNKFTDALAELPFSPEVHYNLGNSFYENKEFENAISEYDQAIKLSEEKPGTEELRFYALFNSAVALSELKRVDEALERYQKALELNPDSTEAKTNIELLTQQQQGGGQGENQQDQQDQKGDQDQKNEGEGEQKDQQQPQQPSDQKKEKPKPKPFKSEELSQQDVNRILEELKRQEEQIRAKMQREGAKDAPPEKDW